LPGFKTSRFTNKTLGGGMTPPDFSCAPATLAIPKQRHDTSRIPYTFFIDADLLGGLFLDLS
jgi:hypothetical protein